VTGDYGGERLLRKIYTKEAIDKMDEDEFQEAKKADFRAFNSDQSHQSNAGCHNRTNFDTDLMNSVRARDEAWKAAKELLGHSHAIFNPPLDNRKVQKGRAALPKVNAGTAPMKPIKTLEKTLRLTGWRLEKGITDMHRLTDEERTAVLTVLKTLIDSIQTWGVEARKAVAAAKKKRTVQVKK
jgi:hypothetical protein